jgi:hypothetical protein
MIELLLKKIVKALVRFHCLAEITMGRIRNSCRPSSDHQKNKGKSNSFPQPILIEHDHTLLFQLTATRGGSALTANENGCGNVTAFPAGMLGLDVSEAGHRLWLPALADIAMRRLETHGWEDSNFQKTIRRTAINCRRKGPTTLAAHSNSAGISVRWEKSSQRLADILRPY